MDKRSRQGTGQWASVSHSLADDLPVLVNIQTLREVLARLLELVEQQVTSHEVWLPQEFYWSVGEREMWNLDRVPEGAFVGSLMDDWQSILNGSKSPEGFTLELLKKVGPLLQALSSTHPGV